MKAILCLLVITTVLILFSITFAQAQNPPPPRWISPVVTADSCEQIELCSPPDHGCVTSLNFFAPQTGDYVLHVVLDCGSGKSCDPCAGCAWVKHDGTLQCDAQASCDSCLSVRSCPLTGGTAYTITVCLRLCRDHTDCADCSCVAKAWLSGT